MINNIEFIKRLQIICENYNKINYKYNNFIICITYYGKYMIYTHENIHYCLYNNNYYRIFYNLEDDYRILKIFNNGNIKYKRK